MSIVQSIECNENLLNDFCEQEFNNNNIEYSVELNEVNAVYISMRFINQSKVIEFVFNAVNEKFVTKTISDCNTF